MVHKVIPRVAVALLLAGWATGTGYLPAQTSDVEAEAWARNLRGRVVDSGGRPIAGAEVMLVERDHVFPFPEPLLVTVATDAEGEFRIDGILQPIPVSEYHSRMLLIRKEGFGVWGNGLKQTGGDISIKVTMRPEASIQGCVTDADGQPLPGATVTAYYFRCGGTEAHALGFWQIERLAPQAETDGNGTFALTGLPRGCDSTLSVACPGYAGRLVFGVQTGRKGIIFELQREVILRGSAVYEGTRKPVSGLMICTQGHQTSAVSQTVTGENGRFELLGVAAEPCNLFAIFECPRRDAMPAWTAAAIQIEGFKPGDIREDIEVVATKGGIIAGKVTDRKDNPLKGIDIAFYSAARPSTGAACESTLSGEDGSWSYRFPPGQVHVYIRTHIPRSAWMTPLYDLSLDAGQTIEDVNFTLNREVPPDSPYLGARAASPAREGAGSQQHATQRGHGAWSKWARAWREFCSWNNAGLKERFSEILRNNRGLADVFLVRAFLFPCPGMRL